MMQVLCLKIFYPTILTFSGYNHLLYHQLCIILLHGHWTMNKGLSYKLVGNQIFSYSFFVYFYFVHHANENSHLASENFYVKKKFVEKVDFDHQLDISSVSDALKLATFGTKSLKKIQSASRAYEIFFSEMIL